MHGERLGQVCALLSAMNWAASMVLFKVSGERVSPLALNLFKNVVALILLTVTLLLSGARVSELTATAPADMYLMLVSGFIGIAVADTAFFAALNRLGVGFTSVVECVYSPSVILFAVVLLKEQPRWAHFLGAGLILSAVYVSSRHAPPPGYTRRQLVAGFLYGALAMALMALGIVIAKPVLEGDGMPLIWATTLRLLAGTGPLALMALASPNRAKHAAVFRPSRVWFTSIPASVLGAYLAMILWMAGFKYATATTAAMLNQTSSVFALLLAAWFLKEPLTRRKLVAVVLALSGVVCVTLSG